MTHLLLSERRRRQLREQASTLAVLVSGRILRRVWTSAEALSWASLDQTTQSLSCERLSPSRCGHLALVIDEWSSPT